MLHPRTLAFIGIGLLASAAYAADAPAAEQSYRVIKTEKVGGSGGFDYVFADAEGGRLYVPRSDGDKSRVNVYDSATLKSVGEVPKTMGVHGVCVDPKSKRGFTSSNPVVMFDTTTLATIKTINVEGSPDGILFDPATERVFVLSHRAPNVTVLDGRDGSTVGTIDIGGAPEQAASDESGRIYIDVEDKDNVAVIDAKNLKVISHYDLGGKGGTPAGLAIDAKHHILFAFCRKPQTVVILNAEDGKVITSLPIGAGVDAAAFNPATMEAFSSQRDGTLTVIKETSPTEFVVEQTVQTKAGAKTSTLDTKTNQIYLITAESAPAGGQPAGGQGGQRGGGRGRFLPDSFTILVVGKTAP